MWTKQQIYLVLSLWVGAMISVASAIYTVYRFEVSPTHVQRHIVYQQYAAPPQRGGEQEVETWGEHQVLGLQHARRAVVEVRAYTAQGDPQCYHRGTGALLSEEGLVITAGHVLRGAHEVEVFYEGRPYTATVIGYADTFVDVALLKIDASVRGLPYLRFPEASLLKVGQMVYTIGHPHGLNHTVHQGIICHLERVFSRGDSAQTPPEPYMQVDLPMHPGASGSPVVDEYGRLVGLAVGCYEGAGQEGKRSVAQPCTFAIPYPILRKAVDDFQHKGFFSQGVFPLALQETGLLYQLSKQKLASFRSEEEFQRLTSLKDKVIEHDLGPGLCVVEEPARGSAAYEAGIRLGDVVVMLNGQATPTYAAWIHELRQHGPHEKLKLVFDRGDERKTAYVLLQASPLDQVGLLLKENTLFVLGLALIDAKQEVLSKIKQAHREELSGGVQVKTITTQPQAGKRVRPSFVITHIDKLPVRNIQELRQRLIASFHNKDGRNNAVVIMQGYYPDGSADHFVLTIDKQFGL